MKGRASVQSKVKYDRIQRIQAMLASGLMTYEIVEKLISEWNCSRSAVYKYMVVAHEAIKTHFDKQDLNELLVKYNLLYMRALSEGDNKLAKSILDSVGRFTIGDKITHDGQIKMPDVIKLIETKKTDNE